MRPRTHAAFGALGASTVFLLSSSASAGMAFAVIHILMDLDHFPDYFLWNPAPFKLKNFIRLKFSGNPKRAMRLFHAYEWLAIGAFFAFTYPSWELISAVLGYGSHLCMDFVGSRKNRSPFFYFISLRALNGFKANHRPYHAHYKDHPNVLARAKGKCELCGIDLSAKYCTTKPAFELHAIRQEKDGPDASEHVVAICPNCHDAAHREILRANMTT